MNPSTAQSRVKVVIVGGGFGGVRAAIQLAKHPDLAITLISQDDSFAYYPQLYHAATGGMRSEASIPLLELLGGKGIDLIHDLATKLDTDKRVLTTESGASYEYDQLILALGGITNYFGIAGLAEFSYDIKTIEGAEAFKDHLHHQLITERKPELNYVVVGAGPTGVELSAALGEYLGRIIARHGITKPNYRIDLVEAAPHILPRLSEKVAARVQRRLEKLGVTVMTGAVVEAETADMLRLKGQDISSRTVVWTAGVANNGFFAANGFTLAKNGRVVVNEYMEASTNVYVIGDNAFMPYGGLAETAVNDANFVATDIMRKHAMRPRKAYKQPIPFSVVPVGKGWAVAQHGKLTIYGYIGWILRRLGDLVAYSDIESPIKALRVWLKEPLHEDDCPVCNAKAVKAKTLAKS